MSNVYRVFVRGCQKSCEIVAIGWRYGVVVEVFRGSIEYLVENLLKAYTILDRF